MQGKLASGTIATINTDQLIYTAPASARSVEYSVSAVNKNAALTPNVQLAIGTGASPANGDYLEKSAVLDQAGGVVLRTGILSPGEKLWINSDQLLVDFRVEGKVVTRMPYKS